LKAGDVITEDAVRSVRPGYGLAPKYRSQVVGQQLRHDVARHTPVQWSQWS
jgi:N-acetylneuraminate synthase